MHRETKEWIEKKADELDDSIINFAFMTKKDADERHKILNDFLTLFVQELVFKIILTGVNKGDEKNLKPGICLTIREAKVLYLRAEFGEKKTLEQVAKIFKVTRERIRQIEIKAVKKLKYSLADKLLKDTMGKLEKEGIIEKVKQKKGKDHLDYE